MPNHKKTPAFIRVLSRDNQVICVNPLQLSSFHIVEKAKVKTGTKEEPKFIEADTINFYFPAGTTLRYVVGIDITQDDFNYICATLLEFLYLNEAEFQTRSETIAKEKMDDWNKISQENQEKLEDKTTKA